MKAIEIQVTFPYEERRFTVKTNLGNKNLEEAFNHIVEEVKRVGLVFIESMKQNAGAAHISTQQPWVIDESNTNKTY